MPRLCFGTHAPLFALDLTFAAAAATSFPASSLLFLLPWLRRALFGLLYAGFLSYTVRQSSLFEVRWISENTTPISLGEQCALCTASGVRYATCIVARGCGCG